MATIQKRGDTYRIRVSCGYAMDGTQIIRSVTWKPDPSKTQRQNDKALEQEAVLFEKKVRDGLYLDGSTKFSEFAEKWIKDYAETQLAPATIASYNFYLKRLNQAIGHLRLDKLQPNQIMEFYQNLAEENIRADTKYCSKIDFSNVLKDRCLTKLSFAMAADLAVASINKVVAGKNVTKKTAEAVCKSLDIKLKDAFEAKGKAKLTGNTISHYHRLLSSILSTAVEWQVIIANPCDRVSAPKISHKEALFLDEGQASQLIELLESEPIQYKTAIILLLYSGMRRGELLGLEWSDFDYKKYTASIMRSSQYLPGKGIFTKTPKNTSSARVIKLPAVAFNLLMEFKVTQAEDRVKLGDQWQETNRLFTTWNGTPMHPDTLTSWFEDFIKRHPQLPDIHIHSLRHSNATLMIASGTNVRTVSHRLGHSQTSTTMNIYSHAIQSADEAAADSLGDMLNPEKKKQGKRGA